MRWPSVGVRNSRYFIGKPAPITGLAACDVYVIPREVATHEFQPRRRHAKPETLRVSPADSALARDRPQPATLRAAAARADALGHTIRSRAPADAGGGRFFSRFTMRRGNWHRSRSWLHTSALIQPFGCSIRSTPACSCSTTWPRAGLRSHPSGGLTLAERARNAGVSANDAHQPIAQVSR
jgi:hypothetical protein